MSRVLMGPVAGTICTWHWVREFIVKSNLMGIPMYVIIALVNYVILPFKQESRK